MPGTGTRGPHPCRSTLLSEDPIWGPSRGPIHVRSDPVCDRQNLGSHRQEPELGSCRGRGGEIGCRGIRRVLLLPAAQVAEWAGGCPRLVIVPRPARLASTSRGMHVKKACSVRRRTCRNVVLACPRQRSRTSSMHGRRGRSFISSASRRHYAGVMVPTSLALRGREGSLGLRRCTRARAYLRCYSGRNVENKKRYFAASDRRHVL